MAFGSVLCLSMIPGQMPVVMHPVAVAAESTEEAVVMNSVKYILVTEADRTYYQGTEVIDKNITSVIIPAEINGKSAEIHQNIFSQCPNLKEIIIQEGNIYNTSADGVLFSDGGYKMLAYELKNLSVLESVIYYEPETYIEGMNREKQDNASETISIKMEKK